MTSPLGNRLLVTFGVAMLLLVLPVAASATAATKSIYVPRDYPTIQAAVDAAPSGATIHVAQGTYTEQIVIDKDLTLRGAGPSATVIAAPSTVTTVGLNLLNGLPIAALVLVGHGANVSVSGLEVRGPLPCAPVNGVLVIHGATLNLSDARIDDIEPATPDCGVPTSGHAVVYGLPPFIVVDGQHGSNAFGRLSNVVVDGQHGSNAFGRLSNVVVDDYLTEGLTATGGFTGVPTHVTFADNVVNPGTPPIAADQFAINIRFAATATITGNTVTGAVCTFDVCGADPIAIRRNSHRQRSARHHHRRQPRDTRRYRYLSAIEPRLLPDLGQCPLRQPVLRHRHPRRHRKHRLEHHHRRADRHRRRRRRC
jgi:hypothetical protein